MQKILVILSFVFVLSIGAKAQDTLVFDSYKAMVQAVKAEIVEISIDDFHKMYTQALSIGGIDFTLIDIRTESEFEDGSILGAFLVQRGTLESRLEKDAVWEAFNHKKPQKVGYHNFVLPKWKSFGSGGKIIKDAGIYQYSIAGKWLERLERKIPEPEENELAA